MSLRRAAERMRAALPLLVSATLLALIATRFDGWHTLADLDLGWLALGLAIAFALDIVLGGVKWWFVVNSSGVALPLRRAVTLWAGLMPATFFTPFQSGHLLFAVTLGRAKSLSPVRALEVAGYDKWATLHGTFALILIGQLLLPAGHDFAHPAITACAVVALLIFAADQQLLRVLGRWKRFREASQLLHNPITPGRKLTILLLATAYQASDSVSMLIAVAALGAHVDPLVVFGAFPLVLLVSYVPITFSGFGVREPTIAAIFSASLSFDEAIACGLLVSLLEYVWIALIGVIGLPALIRVLVHGPDDPAQSAADGAPTSARGSHESP